MKKIALVAALMFSLGANAQNWKLDPAHSSVKFKTKYLLISELEGSFKKFDGTFTATKPDFTDLQATMSVEVASVNTDNDMRDGHLKGDDFFNAEKFPTMTFKSTGIRSLGKGKLIMTGMLTIRDVTKKVEVPLFYGGTVKDPWGNTRAGFKATGTINRQDYKLTWSKKTETGEAVVADDVEFTIDASLIKQ
jgi:polyisoprenoid-binding protein YceI